MAISEAQLETWNKLGPTAQFTSTYEALRDVLNDSSSPYWPKSFEIFLQGSYKNSTNVYGDSDVDVVIRLDSIFYTDLYFLSEEEKSVTILNVRRGTIASRNLKHRSFLGSPKSMATTSNLATKQSSSKATAPAVETPTFLSAQSYVATIASRVRATTLRRWNLLFLTQRHPDRELPREARRELHDKAPGHAAMVQANCSHLQKSSQHDDQKKIEDGLAPSYFIEGMLYNVPPTKFGGSEQMNFKDVLNWLLSADRDKFVCANEQFKLLGGAHVTWPAANCTQFLNAVKSYNDAA
ncbi:nucleotidyltransferase [Bradyrhizobium elkanii]|uniref:nucleotidyltransferase domain-containing protein n=1 Tax=Bradyrhizobium elkanii TaxID=29448 RepID=UPI002FF01FD3